jgi:hypothetical protein
VIGINGSGNGVWAKKVAIAGAKDGSAQIVIVASDDNVYHIRRFADGTWPTNGFQPVLYNGGLFAARDVAITINADTSTSQGNAQVIANSLSAGGVYYCVRWANASWTNLTMVPAATGVNTSQLAIATSEVGNTYVLATVLTTYASQIFRQIRYPDGHWDAGFTPVYVQGAALPTNADVALTLTPSGNAQMAYTNQYGAFVQTIANPVNAASWTSAPISTVMVSPAGSKTVSLSAPPSGTGASAVVISRTSAQ